MPASAALQSPSAPAQASADAAVRWRISAAILDNILVWFGYLAVCRILGWRVASFTHLAALIALDIVYHFVLEARDGQTIGKRRYGLRVVSVDDGVAGPKAIAIRSVLRIIDSLPVWYASGLVSLVRTGPSRRQRIGDVVAGTKVVAEGGLSTRGTPRWMLPAATLAAVGLSALFIYATTQAGNQPLTAAQSAEWVAGCSDSTGGLVDCQCMLTRLEGDGYDTLNKLTALKAEVAREETAGQVGSALGDLRSAALSCRQ